MTSPTSVIADVAMIMRQDRSRQSIFLQSQSLGHVSLLATGLLDCLIQFGIVSRSRICPGRTQQLGQYRGKMALVEYELQRLQRIAENRKRMEEMGIFTVRSTFALCKISRAICRIAGFVERT